MGWFVKALNKDEKGFTLIELIVVIAILGILAAIAVPRVTTSLSNAKASANKASLKIIQDAIERYYVENNNTYPTDLQTLVNGGYLDSLPKTAEGHDFQYSNTTGIVSIPSGDAGASSS
ncbi:prepilin-type cleavage/methylation domain-containing protein [Thermoanaerobacterium thermosaccharolyticum]|uniref:Prepilin-type cleavage/methylation domain-containing protein n=1 Tax=Thermoanaerobacterium thermosaccharolyticum TaxID=1517 RepID=A0A231VHI7_THETR|nr:prepilin-type N-terminal cleavage/methylation domain-containing protein [Thermoanaerobacterium thermosaccharolyticum]OXT07665.1 prepilin-type cleavage/methylation domain-containing protein [Thermoanaerobacterium thermosaccharolyticum]